MICHTRCVFLQIEKDSITKKERKYYELQRIKKRGA